MQTDAFRTILVPLDGSASATAALRLALRLAAPDGELILAHVINRAAVVAECVTPYGGDATAALEALEADERDVFAAGEALAREAAVACTTVSLDGVPAVSIAMLARERRVDAIAMGTHGRRGLARIVLGSTAARVLHDAVVPTFVVHEQSAGISPSPFRQILVALDASPAARSACRAAIALAAHDGAHVYFASVDEGRAHVDRGVLADALAAARDASVIADDALLHGGAVDAILVAAETCHADLIALGAHGRSGLFGMGSVTEAIVRTSAVPVLVVPPPTAPAAAGGVGGKRSEEARDGR